MDTSRRHASARACRAFPQTVATNNVSDSAIRLYLLKRKRTNINNPLAISSTALPNVRSNDQHAIAARSLYNDQSNEKRTQGTHKHIVIFECDFAQHIFLHTNTNAKKTTVHRTRRHATTQHILTVHVDGNTGRPTVCPPQVPASCIAAISEYLRHTRLRPRRLFAPAPISRPAAEPALRRASALLWLRAEAVGSGGGRSAKAVSARRDPPQSCARPT